MRPGPSTVFAEQQRGGQIDVEVYSAVHAAHVSLCEQVYELPRRPAGSIRTSIRRINDLALRGIDALLDQRSDVSGHDLIRAVTRWCVCGPCVRHARLLCREKQ